MAVDAEWIEKWSNVNLTHFKEFNAILHPEMTKYTDRHHPVRGLCVWVNLWEDDLIASSQITLILHVDPFLALRYFLPTI